MNAIMELSTNRKEGDVDGNAFVGIEQAITSEDLVDIERRFGFTDTISPIH
jgi:hypothetical protein